MLKKTSPGSDSVFLRNRNTNNNFRAMVFTTSHWKPGNVGGTFDSAPIGSGTTSTGTRTCGPCSTRT